MRCAAATVAYVLVLHYAYVEFMAPTFGYLGFRARGDIDRGLYTLAVGAVAIISATLPRKVRRPSDFMLWCAFVLTVAPSMTAAFYAEIVDPAEATRLAAAMGGCFAGAVLLVRKGPRFALRVKMHPHLAAAIVAGFTMLTYSYLAATIGLQFRLVGLADVQDLRFEYRESAATAGLIGYLLPTQAYVVNPLIMVRGIYRRQPSLFALGVFGQVLLYSLAGHKMAILSPIAIVLIYLAYRHGPRLNGATILYGVLGVATVSLAIDHLLTDGDMTFIFVERLILIPAALTAAFVATFAGHDKVGWGHSFLSPFVDNPYSLPPNYYVGASFNGNSEISANANFFADGYANYGYVGMAIETVAFVVVLWLLDAALKNLPMPVAASILALPALALANTSIFTAMASQGVAMVILLGLLLPRNGWAGGGRRRAPAQPTSAEETSQHGPGHGPTRPGSAFTGGHASTVEQT